MFLRRTGLVDFGLIILCLFFIHGCQNQIPVVPGLEAEGTLVAFTECKIFDSDSSSSGILTVSDSDQECIEYTYAGSILRIKHINAAFNCCLDGIVGSVSIDGSVIRIESEGILTNEQGCLCDCLYDVDYEIKNLKPSIYVIIGPTFSRSLEIDLRKRTSDRYCESRACYPWR